jgi:hypothetical protein
MNRMAVFLAIVIAACLLCADSADAAKKKRKKLPRPEAKPAELVQPEKPAPPLPRPKPALAKEEAKPAEEPKVPEQAETAQPEAKPDPGIELALCREELKAQGVTFTIAEIPATEKACTVNNPVSIAEIATPEGVVILPEKPILNCVFAKRFSSWIADIASPVVMAHAGTPLASLATGPGYQCRGRNGDTTAKISEHAFGNAIDIAAFRLANKKSVAVNAASLADKESGRWLTALRISGCGYFTTVLGPGANQAHAEHFHFDLGIHGKSGNYRICE